MALATLTHTGRAAIAKAIASQKLYLGWGSGEAAWDAPDAVLPSLVTATQLYHEVGRRLVSTVGFVTPDENGGIVIPVTSGALGTEVHEARYTFSTTPTPYLYCLTNFDFADAANVTIREMGVFMGGSFKPDCPIGQRYFLPGDIVDPGLLLAVQIIKPAIARSASVRQAVEFVLPI